MDPASLSNLDPKLRETYERVMGATTPAAGTTPPAVDSTTPAAPVGEPGISQTVTTPAPENTTQTPPAADGTTPMVASVMENSAPSEQPQTVTINQPLPAASNVITQPHGHMGLIKVLYFLGGTVFFVIYVFFWMKIFNFSLPF